MAERPRWMVTLGAGAGAIAISILLLNLPSWTARGTVLVGVAVFLLVLYFDPATFYRRLVLSIIAIAFGLLTPLGLWLWQLAAGVMLLETEHPVSQWVKHLIDAIRGHEGKMTAIFLGFAAIAIWADVKLRLKPPAAAATPNQSDPLSDEPRDRRLRSQMLSKVRLIWIDGFLASSVSTFHEDCSPSQILG